MKIYTKELSEVLLLAEKNFNTQYGGLTLHTTQNFHDRFLIIDDKTIYLIGASLKDAGKRLFAFTQMNAAQINTIKSNLKRKSTLQSAKVQKVQGENKTLVKMAEAKKGNRV